MLSVSLARPARSSMAAAGSSVGAVPALVAPV